MPFLLFLFSYSSLLNLISPIFYGLLVCCPLPYFGFDNIAKPQRNEVRNEIEYCVVLVKYNGTSIWYYLYE